MDTNENGLNQTDASAQAAEAEYEEPDAQEAAGEAADATSLEESEDLTGNGVDAELTEAVDDAVTEETTDGADVEIVAESAESDDSEAEGEVESVAEAAGTDDADEPEVMDSSGVIIEAESDEELFLAALAGDVATTDEGDEFMFAPLKRGQIVSGTIASMSDTEILIDVGAKSEGIIKGRELERLDREVLAGLQVGEDIDVYVLNPEDRQGHILLSLNRALEEQDWILAEEYMQNETVYESKVSHYNKGGLIVRFGRVRGFVPASQVSRDRRRRSNGNTPEERWGSMVGEEISVKVIEVDRGRNRLILSERAAAREKRAERRAELLDSLSVGQVLTGYVISLADFGAFVDLGGADGLIHLSELSYRHVDHPRDVLKVGEEVEVEIIHIDPERQRIGLSRKSRLEDPWDRLAREYEPDQLVQGRVTKLTKFGAFARLVDAPEIEGLIHISELADRRVEHPSEVVNEDEVLTLRILRIDTDRRRVGLSLKRVDSSEYLSSDWREMLDSVNTADDDQSDDIVAEVEEEVEDVEEVEDFGDEDDGDEDDG